MAGKPNYSAAGFLNLLFFGTAFGSTGANIAINATAGILGNFGVSIINTTDPTSTGGQNTNELNYGNYARVSLGRNTVGWTITNATATVSPNANITFNPATNNTGSGTAGFFGIGDSGSVGTNGNLFYVGALTPNITISNGVTPVILNNSTIQETLIDDININGEVITRHSPFLEA